MRNKRFFTQFRRSCEKEQKRAHSPPSRNGETGVRRKSKLTVEQTFELKYASDVSSHNDKLILREGESDMRIVRMR